MRNIRQNGSVWAAVLWLALCGAPGLVQAAPAEEAERELQSLDAATRIALAREMIGRMDQSAPAENAERELQSLDAVTQNALAREMIGRMNQPAARDATPAAASARACPPPAGAGTFNPSEVRFFINDTRFSERSRFLPEREFSGRVVEITAQPRNHLMITVGDIVWLATPGLTLPVDSRYSLYKRYRPQSGSNPSSGWFVEVGKVKILESGPSLTIGRIIAAGDVIQVGDVALVSRE